MFKRQSVIRVDPVLIGIAVLFASIVIGVLTNGFRLGKGVGPTAEELKQAIVEDDPLLAELIIDPSVDLFGEASAGCRLSALASTASRKEQSSNLSSLCAFEDSVTSLTLENFRQFANGLMASRRLYYFDAQVSGTTDAKRIGIFSSEMQCEDMRIRAYQADVLTLACQPWRPLHQENS